MPQPADTMPGQQDERPARFHAWIDDPSAITNMADQVELLEGVLSCPYELPAAARIRASRPQLPMLRHYSSQL